jgi:hypothetical protein
VSNEADTLAQAQARIAELEGAQRAQIKTQAVTEALSKFDLVPGSLGQIAALLDGDISIQSTADGRQVVMGPAFRNLDETIRDTLAKPEFAHFRRSQAGLQPAAPGPAATSLERRHDETIGQWYARHAAARPQLPGENMAQTLVRIASETRAAGPADDRTNMNRPMGLRGTIR